jgi:hypothetical protein
VYQEGYAAFVHQYTDAVAFRFVQLMPIQGIPEGEHSPMLLRTTSASPQERRSLGPQRTNTLEHLGNREPID